MKARQRPLVLLAPGVAKSGAEFSDLSVSLSDFYGKAVLDAGGLPLLLTATTAPNIIRSYVAEADGILMSGGDDIAPELYDGALPSRVRRTVGVTPDGGRRDLFELLLVKEVLKQRKALLAICRGHQILNVALGGTLIADIPLQTPGSLNHRRMDRRNEVVHEVRLTADSLLAKIAGTQLLGVNSTHHQAVGQVAAPLQATAMSPDGIIEGLELKPSSRGLVPFLVSVQFHPERLATRHKEHRRIFREFVRACAHGGNL